MRTTKTLLALLLSFAGLAAQGAATITIINANAPGVGFNDTTPAAPVGGNTGTTLGQQRLIAFQHAASIWGAALDSSVVIRVRASFEPLACNASSAVLGSAGAADIFADFPGAPRTSTWYPSSLASKLANVDLSGAGSPHITARFNSRLGLFPDCLPGSPFYLGLDNNHGGAIDLVTVLLHEIGHGLGYQTFTDGETGEEEGGLPSIWDYFLTDNRTMKHWVEMDNGERASSAVSVEHLVWDGPHVKAAAPQVLAGRSNLAISGPAAGSAAGNYLVGDASFGPPLQNPAVSGQLMPVVDQPNGTGLACTPLNAANATAVHGNIALVDRGSCNFTVKARNVQDAGAIGMVVVDNVPGPLTGLGGTDPTITIPAVRITQSDGNAIKPQLERRSRTRSGVIAALGQDPNVLAGADSGHRLRMYAPDPYEPGSSVSHTDVSARPNQLMEPAINGDLTHMVTLPRDLATELLKDIGW